MVTYRYKQTSVVSPEYSVVGVAIGLGLSGTRILLAALIFPSEMKHHNYVCDRICYIKGIQVLKMLLLVQNWYFMKQVDALESDYRPSPILLQKL